MNRVTLVLLNSMLIVFLQAQNSPAKREFRNEGEREEYNLKYLFEKQYAVQDHKKYADTIELLDQNTFRFKARVLRCYDSSKVWLLKLGILYPDLFDDFSALGQPDTVTIGHMNELKNLSSPTRKRYQFWVYHKGLANPVDYVIELTNQQATKETDPHTFIIGSRLTFFKPNGVII